jgi:hypothetical protein
VRDLNFVTSQRAAELLSRMKPSIEFRIRKSGWPTPFRGDEFQFNGSVFRVCEPPVDDGEAWAIRAIGLDYLYAESPDMVPTEIRVSFQVSENTDET